MAKISLTRKSITAIVIIAVLLIIGGTATGVWYGISHKELATPEPEVKAIFAEPDYTIELGWEPVKGAEKYTVEYRYTLFEDSSTIHKAADIADTYLTVARKRGVFAFRVTAHGKYKESVSEWKTYFVAPLELDELGAFNLQRLSGRTYRLDGDTFEPVSYNFKGQTYTINYYELLITYPDGSVDPNPEPIAYSDIASEESNAGIKLHLPMDGNYEIAIRPVLYVYVFDVKDYEALGIYELYEPNTHYTRIQLSV